MLILLNDYPMKGSSRDGKMISDRLSVTPTFTGGV